MLTRGAAWLLVLALGGCVRPVRLETRERPVEAGLEAPFVAEAPRRWDFGDGSPPVTGAQVRHAFARAGRYVVRGYEGETLREQIALVVLPRAALHLVPPDASRAFVARGLEELAPLVDFGERLAGPDAVQRWAEATPLVAWAFEQASAAGASPVDAREGLALFAWPDAPEASLSVVGVRDEAGALEGFTAWLTQHGWSSIGVVQGLHRFEQEGRALDVFLDRGALYAVEAPLTGRLPGAQARIAAASALGLEADGPVATALDALPSGGLVVFTRALEALSWRFATAAVRLSNDEARLEGRLHGPKPLWVTPPLPPSLLARAPEGPVLAASASLPPAELSALLLGAPGAPRRRELDGELSAHGADVAQLVAAFSGLFELAVYADVPGFVRGTLRGGGRPRPSGTVLFEAPVSQQAPVEAFVEALGARWGLDFKGLSDKSVRVWRGKALDLPVEAALTQKSLFARVGSPVEEREAVDLSASLSKRFEGAFTAGHLSVFVDVGQLRRELLTPHLMVDVDPRRALTAQALAVTLLDKLTQLDFALVDLAPAPEGAAVQLVLGLRPKEP